LLTGHFRCENTIAIDSYRIRLYLYKCGADPTSHLGDGISRAFDDEWICDNCEPVWTRDYEVVNPVSQQEYERYLPWVTNGDAPIRGTGWYEGFVNFGTMMKPWNETGTSILGGQWSWPSNAAYIVDP
jgi:hypothetical protein